MIYVLKDWEIVEYKFFVEKKISMEIWIMNESRVDRLNSLRNSSLLGKMDIYIIRSCTIIGWKLYLKISMNDWIMCMNVFFCAIMSRWAPQFLPIQRIINNNWITQSSSYSCFSACLVIQLNETWMIRKFSMTLMVALSTNSNKNRS